jgi:hypothetical protein
MTQAGRRRRRTLGNGWSVSGRSNNINSLLQRSAGDALASRNDFTRASSAVRVITEASVVSLATV